MAIDGGMRGKLESGTRLVARYKGAEHLVEVVTDAGGKQQFRLADGREFRSPSAAGSAIMGGQACNGWRFWSIADPSADESPVAPGTPAAKPRPQCIRCRKQFVGQKQLAHHQANAERLCIPA